MAVSITDNITTQNDMDSSASFTSIGGGPGASLLTAMVYQGTQAGARRIGSANSDHGFWVTEGTTRNINTGGFQAFWFKGFIKQRAALNAIGQKLRLGSAQTAYYEWTMGDDGTIVQPGFEYAIAGGFNVQPVYIGLRAWHDQPRTGTPDVTVIDEYGITHNVSVTANGEDCALDALQYSINGLFMTGGSPDGTFQDFLDADEGEGSATADRIGMWQSRQGIFFVFAKHVIGRTNAGSITATQFTDSFKTIVFPGGKTNTNFNGFEWDLGNASTAIELNSCSFIGQGRSTYKIYFDTELDVTTATSLINIPSHDFTTGDQVAYSAEGGTQDIGPDATSGEGALVTGTTIPTGDRWYVIVTGSDTIRLASTFSNALLGSFVSLTASSTGNGENHSLTRTPDTRPDFDFNGTTGSAIINSCQFNRYNEFNLTSAVMMNSCVIIGSQSMDLSSATLSGCTIAQQTTSEGEAFITASSSAQLANITNTDFIAGNFGGHAIEITTTATSVALTGNTFTNYGGDPDPGNGWQFDTETDITGGSTDTISYTSHGMTTGDPIYYENEGGTENIGLTDGNLYYIRADDASTLGIFLTREGAETNVNRINLTPSSGGNGETHALYSANAAFHNSTGSTITLNITGGTSPSVRNSNSSITIVQNAVTLTVTVRDETSNPIQNVRVRIERQSDLSLITDGTTNISGIFSDSFNYTSDLNVNIIVRLVGYIPFETTGTINNSGLSVNVRFIKDTIVDRLGP